MVMCSAWAKLSLLYVLKKFGVSSVYLRCILPISLIGSIIYV